MNRHARLAKAALVLGCLALVSIVALSAATDDAAPASQPAKKKQFLFEDSTRLIDRAGIVVNYEVDILGAARPLPWHRSAFLTSADKYVFILLENAELEKLEDFTRRGETEVRVTGTVTRYRNRNYLFLTRIEERDVQRKEEPW